MKAKFYRCPVCGNVVVKTVDSGVDLVCCGEEMEELVPQHTETGLEKHVPVWQYAANGEFQVKVGSVEHPMLPAHYIQFIYVETQHGGMFKTLSADDKPQAVFTFAGDAPVAVYEYCNLHGLWKSEVK